MTTRRATDTACRPTRARHNYGMQVRSTMPRIPSVAAFLKPDNGYEPTEAERRLIAACQEGEPCILSNECPTEATDANTIRAELIRLLILGGT